MTPEPQPRPGAVAGDLAERLGRRLEAVRSRSGWRTRPRLDGPQGVHPIIDGRRYLAFCSNDYLGLAGDPRVAEALAAGARRHGTGAGASHLVCGHGRAHGALEEDLAAHVGRERALLFSSGYLANLAVAATLAGRGDTILEDRLNHASLVDGALLSRARLRRYAHADPDHLAALLARCETGLKLVLTDGVFSMDGDEAPLPRLSAVCGAAGAWLAVDDAHGVGVQGPSGAGTVAAAGLGEAEVPVLVGTLGKALGVFGAFVAGPAALIEVLIQSARSYIYTTALPPAVAEAARTALAIARAEDWRRAQLARLGLRLREGAAELGLGLGESTTPIVPLVLGSSERALATAASLRAAGLFVPAIRPPTVPAGSARLRISLSAAHREADIDRLLEALAAALPGPPR